MVAQPENTAHLFALGGMVVYVGALQHPYPQRTENLLTSSTSMSGFPDIHTLVSLPHLSDLSHNPGTFGGRWAPVEDCHPPHVVVFKEQRFHFPFDANPRRFQLKALKLEMPAIRTRWSFLCRRLGLGGRKDSCEKEKVKDSSDNVGAPVIIGTMRRAQQASCF